MSVSVTKIYNGTLPRELAEEQRTSLLLKSFFREDGLSPYLLIDGTCRHHAVGAFDLDLLEEAPLSLLNPGGGVELSPSGAYLVDLSAILKIMGTGRFCRFFLKPWGQQHSIVMRANLSALELQRHLRKFIRLKRADNGRIVYLRFWDARVALPYFTGLSSNPTRYAQWFDPRGPGKIEEVLFETDDPWLGWRVLPELGVVSAGPQAIKSELSLEEIAVLRNVQMKTFDRKIAGELFRLLGHMTPKALGNVTIGEEFIAMIRRDAKRWGISSERGVTRFSIASIILGFNFASDPSLDAEQNLAIRAKDASEAEKLKAVRVLTEARIASLPERCRKIRMHLWSGSTMTPGEVFCTLYPQWFGGLNDAERKSVIDGFHQQSSILSTFDEIQLSKAALLTLIFGFFWPRNPLYRDILKELSGANIQLPLLQKRLDELNHDDNAAATNWLEARS